MYAYLSHVFRLLVTVGLLAFTSTCADESSAAPGPLILVEVSGNLANTAAVQIVALLNQRLPTAPVGFKVPLETNQSEQTRTFGLRLDSAETATGEIRVAVGLYDASSCLRAVGENTALLTGDQSHVAVRVDPLDPPPTDQCSETLPVLLKVSPEKSNTLSGELITLRGFGFLPGVRVSVDDVQAADVSWLSPLAISARLPALPGRGGLATVAVRNVDGSQAVRGDLLSLDLQKVEFGADRIFLDVQVPTCGPEHVVAADLNGDSHPDLISIGTFCSGAPMLSIHWNRGDGSFASQISEYHVPERSVGLVVDQLDQDEFLDVAIASAGDNVTAPSVMIYRGSSAGALLEPPAVYPLKLGLVAHDLTLGQVIGDPRPDLVVASSDQTNPGFGAFSFLRNTGSGFVLEGDRKTAFEPCRVVVSDLNGDRVPELSALGCQGSLFVVPNSEGVLGNYDYYANAFGGPHALVAKDLNRDGLPDIVMANYNMNNADVLLNQSILGSPPKLGAQHLYAAQNGPFGLAIADLDFDGYPEVAVANRESWASVTILFNRGDGTFDENKTQNLRLAQAGDKPNEVAMADFNHDGLTDLAIATSGASRLSIILNQSE